MKTQNKYWMIIALALGATVMALCVVAVLFWHNLPQESQQWFFALVIDNFGYFFSAGFFLLMAFGFAADWIFRAYVRPINRLSEEIELINTVNPDLRVSVRGSFDVRRLARVINQSAELVARLQRSQTEQLNQARAEPETEKAILAILLADLPQGIVVCNLDGQIVFYNRKAKNLLMSHQKGPQESGDNGSEWIGLGRSLFGFISQALIEEVLARITKRISEDGSMVNERFLVGTKDHTVLPAELLPVLDSQHHVTGYIVYIEDLSETMRVAEEDSKHLQVWQHQLTQSIATLKAAAGLVRDESLHADHELRQIVQILAEQSDLAAQLWTQKEVAQKWTDKAAGPMTPIVVERWAELLWQQITPHLNLELKIGPEDLQTEVSIDVHHMTRIIVTILERVRAAHGIDGAQAHFFRMDNWLYIDIIWNGQGLDQATVKQWKAETIDASGAPMALSMGTILSFHKAKLWVYREAARTDWAGVRLLIPTLEQAGVAQFNGHVTILPEARPEYYDFDLFQQAGQSPELDNRPLNELTFTVFDTETTGLNPSGGDEIISIGAIRIVNGRLLHEEQFGQLIDPKRHLPWESIKYHGIRPEMLVDQPTIEQVLPAFQRFAQGTILVGHNVAFDMRMLQVKESLTGVSFINPVLDTLLLSSVVHPAQEDHSLNNLAQRLGVNIVGRHTATGDALATAEIFLKLLSLLANQGIFTLGDAREASKSSYYARLKY